MQIALLNASLCGIMNGKGVVRDRQKSVECYELGEKLDKNMGTKTHNGNNLAKLNDAKCTISCPPFTQGAFEE